MNEVAEEVLPVSQTGLYYEPCLYAGSLRHEDAAMIKIARDMGFETNTFWWDDNIVVRCEEPDARRVMQAWTDAKLKFTIIPSMFRFRFKGRQTNAIGQVKEILDTYKCEFLGQALHMLHHQYDVLSMLNAYEDRSKAFSYVPLIPISLKVVEKTAFIKCDASRETSPNTGTYKYYRHDAPDDYKW